MLRTERPSVGLAYGWTRASYDWMMSGTDAANRGLQTVQGLAVAVALGAAALIDARFDSPWFVAGMVAVALAFGLAVWGRYYAGAVWAVSPDKLAAWTEAPPRKFKAEMVHWAGVQFVQNAVVIARKRDAALWATAALAVSVVMFVLWAATE